MDHDSNDLIGPGVIKRRPMFVLICGLLSLVMGGLLILVDVARWYGIGIVAFSLVLIGMWLVDRKDYRPYDLDAEGKQINVKTIGVWYPVALLAIFAIVFVMIYLSGKR